MIFCLYLCVLLIHCVIFSAKYSARRHAFTFMYCLLAIANKQEEMAGVMKSNLELTKVLYEIINHLLVFFRAYSYKVFVLKLHEVCFRKSELSLAFCEKKN